MKVKIRRVDKSLPLPKYQTKGAVAFDVYARVKTFIDPHTVGIVPTNIIIETPKGYVLFIKDRGSTLSKKGLIAHSGFIDQDFCGPEDEIIFQAFNPLDQTVVVEKGERIGQAAFIPIELAEWIEVDSMGHNQTRGKLGSTGGYKVVKK